MTSKEEKYEEWRRYFFEVDKEMYEYFIQDLERLEVLEKELETSQTEKAQIIDLIKKKIAYLENGVFLTSADYLKGAIRILKELLKEVLKNEN